MLYEDFSKGIEEHINHLTLVEDFNAKVRKKLNQEQATIGNFGYGGRNERGTTLMNYLEEQGFYALNSFYNRKPQRRWTCLSPNRTTINEIEYILSSKKYM